MQYVCLAIAQLVKAPTIAACVHVRAEDRGSTPGAVKLSGSVKCEASSKQWMTVEDCGRKRSGVV